MTARNHRRYQQEDLEAVRRWRDLTDWQRVREMTEEEIEAAAASDPDNPPWTKDDLKRARVVEEARQKSR